MAISSHALETGRKRNERKPNLRVLPKSKLWLRSFFTGMVLLLVLGLFVRVGFSAVGVVSQKNLDRTINMISDANEVNREHRFHISELESSQRIYKIAFGSPEELVENSLYGLGMIEPSKVRYLTASHQAPFEKWMNADVSETSQSANGQ